MTDDPATAEFRCLHCGCETHGAQPDGRCPRCVYRRAALGVEQFTNLWGDYPRHVRGSRANSTSTDTEPGPRRRRGRRGGRRNRGRRAGTCGTR